MERINLQEKFAMIHEQWSPRVIAELNGQFVKLAKIEGEFVWHAHAEEDELFLVVRGQLVIEFRDRTVQLGEGDLCVVPRGVEHRPIAEQEVEVLLFEPVTTKHTGDVVDSRTVTETIWI